MILMLSNNSNNSAKIMCFSVELIVFVAFVGNEFLNNLNTNSICFFSNDKRLIIMVLLPKNTQMKLSLDMSMEVLSKHQPVASMFILH